MRTRVLNPVMTLRRALCLFAIFASAVVLVIRAHAADTALQVLLDTSKASPRAVEPLTERGILRDYRFAWTSLTQALELSTLDPLEGPFAGAAKQVLKDTVLSQQRSGLSRQYVNQNHRVETVFYSPEGDVMELHDTAEFELRISDGGKIIHDDHVTMHYIVLMTPGADRWVVRQLQAVPKS